MYEEWQRQRWICAVLRGEVLSGILVMPLTTQWEGVGQKEARSSHRARWNHSRQQALVAAREVWIRPQELLGSFPGILSFLLPWRYSELSGTVPQVTYSKLVLLSLKGWTRWLQEIPSNTIILWQFDCNQYFHKRSSLDKTVGFLKPAAGDSHKLRQKKQWVFSCSKQPNSRTKAIKIKNKK